MHPKKIKKLIVGKNICENIKFLKKLAKINQENKNIYSLIKKATASELLTLVEIAINLLGARFPIARSSKIFRRLSTQAPLIRRLSSIRKPESARSLLLNSPPPTHHQKGSGVPFIAGLLASAVVPVIAEAISKNFLFAEK